jgi:TatD DNase family protein
MRQQWRLGASNLFTVMSEDVLAKLGLPELPEPLPVPVIDSHTHMDSTFEVSGLPLADNLRLAAAVNVVKVAQIGCDLASSEWAVACAAQHPQVIAAVAIHPNDAAVMTDEQLDAALERIETLAVAGPRVRGVGETGLDYFRTSEEDLRQRQQRAFAAHIRIAKAHDKTLAIHDRDAHEDVLRVLDEQGAPQRVIMHCFSGGPEFARQCLERGFWLSFPGTVTFSNAQYLRDALAITPLDRVLVETDAPYLTPAPRRGKRNAPYLIPHTARLMAEVCGHSLETLCAALYANAEAAYGGAW